MQYWYDDGGAEGSGDGVVGVSGSEGGGLEAVVLLSLLSAAVTRGGTEGRQGASRGKTLH